MRTSGTPSTPLSLTLSRAGEVPLYRQLAAQLRGAIADGTLPPGSRLDNEIVLANRLGVSRPTVRRAIQEIVEEGQLTRRRGVGTRVVHVRITTAVETLGIVETLERDGHHPEVRILNRHTLPAITPIARLLGCAVDTPVLRLRRLLTNNQEPFAVLTDFLPAGPGGPASQNQGLSGFDSLLHAAGIRIRSVEERLISRPPTDTETELLRLGSDGVILERTRVLKDPDGGPVTVGIHAFRGDLIAVGVTASLGSA
ncbi:GntR family transcriptional regulator [Mycetocola sp. JXN-3]|uniref:GntR family transcriptional regulator n=1 Tax=Mycetocola sp. JXN-3 TaxID=2116510 RepID=UPI00165CF3B4|nr:GntR family transcriptional regulator [Mycetocola sp. JXN-3]